MKINDNFALIKEFSERLPYDLYFSYCGKVHKLKSVELDGKNTLNNKYPIEICYPYLRPMSSMTEEEDKEFWKIVDNDGSDTNAFDGFELGDDVNWLNTHHFDYRNLIPIGLALEAPEGMYKTK